MSEWPESKLILVTLLSTDIGYFWLLAGAQANGHSPVLNLSQHSSRPSNSGGGGGNNAPTTNGPGGGGSGGCSGGGNGGEHSGSENAYNDGVDDDDEEVDSEDDDDREQGEKGFVWLKLETNTIIS